MRRERAGKLRRAVLLVGFNNWGKTRCIYDLFGKKRFLYDQPYNIPNLGANFTVESCSNDDLNQVQYLQRIQNRINNNRLDLFGAFCPTRQQVGRRDAINDSQQILNQLREIFDEIHLFYLRFKWDNHAELNIREIQQYLQIDNVIHFIADEVNVVAKEEQILARLQEIYQ